MTVKTKEDTTTITQNLEARNKEVDKAYKLIIESTKSLLTSFESKKYRTVIQVDHSRSGRETTLISEFICFFWNLTLSTNKGGYRMIYFSYDEDALAKFGPRLYNRVLRHIFKHTMFETTKLNIEDSVRINNQGADIQNFFINRLANGENNFISIEVEEKAETNVH